MPLLCFASPKGGVGKTTLAANIAGTISRSGRRVVALDLDPQNALRLHFGIPLHDRHGFACRLAERPDWRSCLRMTAGGIGLLPFGPATAAGAMSLAASVAADPALLAASVDDILADPGVCLVVDTAPGPSPFLAALLPNADLIVTVLLVDAASISLVPAIENGAAFGDGGAGGDASLARRLAFALNQFDPRTRLAGSIAQAASRHLGSRLLGMVYRDEHVAEASAAQKLLADYAPGSKATYDVAELARNIVARLPEPDTTALRDQRSSAGWRR